MSEIFRKCLSLLIILSQLAFSAAHANGSVPLPPLKRLGRGVSDRDTGEKLQLACVGALKSDDNEHGCERLQFLRTDSGGEESLIGPVIDITESEHSVTRQIREELKCYGLYKHAATGRFFLFSAGLMPIGEKSRARCEKFKYSTLPESEFNDQLKHKRRNQKNTRDTLSVSLLFSTMLAAGLLGSTAFALFAFPGVYAIAFALDGAIYPARLLFQHGAGPLGTRAENVQALESRARVAWQLKPEQMSSRKFQKLLGRLDVLTRPDGHLEVGTE